MRQAEEPWVFVLKWQALVNWRDRERGGRERVPISIRLLVKTKARRWALPEFPDVFGRFEIREVVFEVGPSFKPTTELG